jgi:hypothetical protein
MVVDEANPDDKKRNFAELGSANEYRVCGTVQPRCGAVGEIEMNADPKRKTHKGDYDRAKEARRHQEEALDDALKNTFPASDPVSIEQPTPPAADHDG